MTSSSLRRTAFTIALVLLAGRLAVPSSVLGADGPSTPLRAGQTRASAAATLRIYLARHGQTDWNVEGRMQGGTDTPLNATGRQQAAALKDHLKDVRFDAVYSSTLSRSRETAEIVRGQVPLTSLAGLGERRFGKFEGLLSDAPDTGPEFLRRRWDPQDALDGGESWVAFTGSGPRSPSSDSDQASLRGDPRSRPRRHQPGHPPDSARSVAGRHAIDHPGQRRVVSHRAGWDRRSPAVEARHRGQSSRSIALLVRSRSRRFTPQLRELSSTVGSIYKMEFESLPIGRSTGEHQDDSWRVTWPE